MLYSIIDSIKNNTMNVGKYKTHAQAVIISCYYNPKKSKARLDAFNKFYSTIKHLNHIIVECAIGNGTFELEETANIRRIRTSSTLWHKEALLNNIIKDLPVKYDYVFWIDADVIFTNQNWLVDGVNAMKNGANIIQPFEYGIHLEKNETEPSFNYHALAGEEQPNMINKKVWRSFCANYSTNHSWRSNDYNTHGHVGFAWGARREILDTLPLYDKALIGGADHIMAHAAVGQLNHNCIMKSFGNCQIVHDWSSKFAKLINGKVSYVEGFLFHIWHGDITKREYLKRIREFQPISETIEDRDENGLYVAHRCEDHYVDNYLQNREVEDNFLSSMALGYATDSALMGTLVGGNPMGAMLGAFLREDDSRPVEIDSNCVPLDQGSNSCEDDPFS